MRILLVAFVAFVLHHLVVADGDGRAGDLHPGQAHPAMWGFPPPPPQTRPQKRHRGPTADAGVKLRPPAALLPGGDVVVLAAPTPIFVGEPIDFHVLIRGESGDPPKVLRVRQAGGTERIWGSGEALKVVGLWDGWVGKVLKGYRTLGSQHSWVERVLKGHRTLGSQQGRVRRVPAGRSNAHLYPNLFMATETCLGFQGSQV